VKSNEGRYERQQFEVGDAIQVSGQLSRHENGKPDSACFSMNSVGSRRFRCGTTDAGDRRQCRQEFSALRSKLDTADQERLYVAAVAAAGNVRREACGTPRCASNLAGVARLAFPEQLVEITFRVTLPGARGEAAVVNFQVR